MRMQVVISSVNHVINVFILLDLNGFQRRNQVSIILCCVILRINQGISILEMDPNLFINTFLCNLTQCYYLNSYHRTRCEMSK